MTIRYNPTQTILNAHADNRACDAIADQLTVRERIPVIAARRYASQCASMRLYDLLCIPAFDDPDFLPSDA
jgi:hypothetical protein